MNISADAVKRLRERTGAGMMECKRALVETQGDLDSAAELMRKSGLTKADKKAARIAAEGTLALARSVSRAALVEVNCETDFVARGEEFQRFAQAVAQAALAANSDRVDEFVRGEIEESRRALIAKIGENVTVRRAAVLDSSGPLGTYLHGTRIGSLVALKGGDEALAKDLAMHVAALNPAYISAAEVPSEWLIKEREILTEQSQSEKKPPDIVAKMVEGRLRKQLAEVTLVGQPFVKDPDTSVEQLLKKSGASVVRFVRFEVGAGIEKKQDDFVGEVMAQVKGSG